MKFALVLSIGIFAPCLYSPASAQHKRGMDLGLSASSGRTFYDKKYYDQPQLASGWETNFKTNYRWSAGAWVEKHLSSHFSTLTEFRFTEEDVPENMLCQCSTVLEVLDMDEKHQWAMVDAGLRYYVKPASELLFFVDGRVEINWLIAARTKRYFMDEVLTRTYMNWNAFGYKRFIPGVALSLGVKIDRLMLSIGGMTDLGRTMIRNPGTYNQVVHPIKTGFFGKGFFVKTSFTLIKLK